VIRTTFLVTSSHTGNTEVSTVFARRAGPRSTRTRSGLHSSCSAMASRLSQPAG